MHLVFFLHGSKIYIYTHIKHANSNLPVRITQSSVSITRHSAIFMWGDGDQLISPSSCSQILDAIVTHTKNHTQNSLNALWPRGMNLSTAKQDWKKKFLIQGFSEAATKEVVCWNFFFLSCSSESSKLRADHCKGHCHICWKSNHWYQHWK